MRQSYLSPCPFCHGELTRSHTTHRLSKLGSRYCDTRLSSNKLTSSSRCTLTYSPMLPVRLSLSLLLLRGSETETLVCDSWQSSISATRFRP
mgnify:CR=1 FL=1